MIGQIEMVLGLMATLMLLSGRACLAMQGPVQSKTAQQVVIHDLKKQERQQIYQDWVVAASRVVSDIHDPRIRNEADVALNELKNAPLGYPNEPKEEKEKDYARFDGKDDKRLVVVPFLPGDEREGPQWRMFHDEPQTGALYVIGGHYLILRRSPISQRGKGSLILPEAFMATVSKQRPSLSIEEADLIGKSFERRLFLGLIGNDYRQLLVKEVDRIRQVRRIQTVLWFHSHPDHAQNAQALKKRYWTILRQYFGISLGTRESELHMNRAWLHAMLQYIGSKERQVEFLDQLQTEVAEGDQFP